MPAEQQPVTRAEFEEVKKRLRELDKDYETLKQQLIRKGIVTSGRTHPQGSKPL